MPFHLAYILKNNQLVTQESCVQFFQSAGITQQETLSALYSHPVYGWESRAGLRHWVQLSFLDKEDSLTPKDYQGIQSSVGLSVEQMIMLVTKKND